MKKIQWTAPHQAKITEVPTPVCGDGQVLLRVKCVGVCGSDMQVFAGRNQYTHFPITPFHEGVLEVAEVYNANSSLKPGMLATVWPFINCGSCYSCQKNRPNACMNFTCLGIQVDGLGAEYYVADEKYVYAIPANVQLDQAVLIEPLSIGMHAASRGDVTGRSVMIVGGGTIGNLTAQACKIKGAAKVCICDISQEKIALARRSGLDGINTQDKSLKEAAEIALNGFPDVIVDCAGVGTIVLQMLEVAGKTATVVIVANHSNPVNMNLNLIQRNELDVRGCIGSHPRDFEQAIEAIANGMLYAENFISGRFRYDQVQEMMEQSIACRGTNIKTVMEW